MPEVPENSFAVMTMHRPSNVDQEDILRPLIDFLTGEVAKDMPLLWPIHPRAKKQLEIFGLWETVRKNIILLNPLGYHDMLRLNMGSKVMLTDSGGLQEEGCILGTPCVTLRDNTERPETVTVGANVLAGTVTETIISCAEKMMNNTASWTNPFGAGDAAVKILEFVEGKH